MSVFEKWYASGTLMGFQLVYTITNEIKDFQN